MVRESLIWTRLLIAAIVMAPLHASAHGVYSQDQKTVDEAKKIKLPLELESFEEAHPQGGASIRGTLETFSLWPIGKVITVCFMGGDAGRRRLFVEASRAWTADLSIRMVFGTGGALFDCATKHDTDLRVGFFPGSSWSRIGQEARNAEPSEPTLNIGFRAALPFADVDNAELRSVMLHETGHALGLLHEHQNPEAKCDEELDWDYLYREYSDRPRKFVEENFRRIVASERFRRYTDYDRLSVMHYALPAVFFKNQTQANCYVPRNMNLSASDKALMRGLYPRTETERDAYLREAMQLASAALAKTPMSSGELVSFGGVLTKIYQSLGTRIRLDFDLKFGAKGRDAGDVETRGCDEVISSARPAVGVKCKIATDASFLSIGGE